MAKVVDKIFRWNASTSPDVVGYKLYVGTDAIDYNTTSVDVGNITEVNLGALSNQGFGPLVNAEGTFNIGVSALDQVGNESDIAVLNGVVLDFVPPAAPTGLTVS